MNNSGEKKITPAEEREFIQEFEFPKYTPELWAAKFGHLFLCGDYRKHTFENKEFEKWIHRVFHILHTENMSELRKQLLSAEEVELIEREIEEGF